MPRYLLTGGRQRTARFVRREEWNSFERALLCELDTDTGAVRTILEYETPAAHCPAEDPSILFKSASWDGDRLLLCTQTEVLVWNGTAVERVLSHPWFNDVHHVARIGGRLHVVSTGLDAVFVLDEAGEVVETHSATGETPWARFDRGTDYRRIATTKPHRAHPNYVFAAGGRRWLTRFEQRDALALDGEGTIPVGDAPIHDGEDFWFTVVSGHVVHAPPAGPRTVWDLNSFPRGSSEPLGWCRGLRVEADRALVGFSRLRPTLFKQNLGWMRAALNRPEPLPSRVTAYDLRGRRELASWNVEEAGMSCVFSVLAVGAASGAAVVSSGPSQEPAS